jgi:hypothetical protein
MPGFIPHFIAGNAVFLIGSYYIINHTNLDYNLKNKLLLYFICIGCSIIPDFPLGLYYTLHVESYNAMLQPHEILHYIISPVAILIFIILDLLYPIKKRPFWIIGILCIIIHIIMDALIQETGIWI